MQKIKRYRLEKLREYDHKTKSETWVSAEKYSDHLDILMQFMSHSTRIVDTHHNNREVRRNFDPDMW